MLQIGAPAWQAHNPAVEHWKAVRKIIAYLKATKDGKFLFQRVGESKMTFFADADYADRCNDMRSVLSVAVVILGNTAVSPSSKIQFCVTLPTREEEYIAMTRGQKTVSEIKPVLDVVQLHFSGSAIGMYEDNKGANTLAENTYGSQRSKHTEVRFHFQRGLVRLGEVTIHNVASAETCGHPYEATRARDVLEAR